MTRYYNVYSNDELYHHGILGMKWGKRNGPPYPLGSGDHSAAERKAGWRSSLKKKMQLTDKQKKYIKIGAGVAVGLLAAYGGYKAYKYLNRPQYEIDLGKKNIDYIRNSVAFDYLTPDSKSNTKYQDKFVKGIDDIIAKESSLDAATNCNPTKSHNNCYNCVSATISRLCGRDAVAKPDTMNGQGMKFSKVCEAFGQSASDTNPNYKTAFGINLDGVDRGIQRMVSRGKWKEGDVGALAVTFKPTNAIRTSGSHTFNWIIKNGKVEFIDGQNGAIDSTCRLLYGNAIDTSKEIQYCKLANINDGLSDTIINNLRSFVD